MLEPAASANTREMLNASQGATDMSVQVRRATVYVHQSCALLNIAVFNN